jgi:hypothetical protein
MKHQSKLSHFITSNKKQKETINNYTEIDIMMNDVTELPM